MKLLLTSAGITNNSIAEALQDLAHVTASKIRVGFIPTAANVEQGNKDWFIQQLTDLHKHGFNWIDIVDISAQNVPWKKRLKKCNVIFISGGNTFHLLNEARKVKFDNWAKENDSKVFVGASAGAIIMTPTIKIATVEPADTDYIGLKNLTGFSFVDFEVSPHTPNVLSYKSNKEYAKNISNKLYTLDDSSAVLYNNGKVEVISKGEWRCLN